MAQHKQLTWNELRVGLFVLAGVILLVVVIFYVTGAGALGPKYLLRTYLSEVDGLTVGAPVRVDGVDVGNVEKIQMAPLTPGVAQKSRSIEVELRIQKAFKMISARTPWLVSLRRGCLESVCGHRSGIRGQVLTNNEEIPARQEKGLKEIV